MKRKFYNGVLLFDKRPGISSHDAVREVRKAIWQRRVGHTGTLDPRAEGLMVLCLGKATKLVQFLSDLDKTYEAEVSFGRTSRTFDSEGIYEDQPLRKAPEMSETELDEFLQRYKGTISQKVPMFSAVHHNGQRLYELARRGQEVDTPERQVRIQNIELISYDKPIMRVRVSCSKGTYIRTLANDIGHDLECGAYLSGLKRTAAGKFTLDDALTIDDIEQLHESDQLYSRLLRYDQVLDYGAMVVSDRFRKVVLAGQDLTADDVTAVEGEFDQGDRVALKDRTGRVLAIGTATVPATRVPRTEGEKLFSYIRVLN